MESILKKLLNVLPTATGKQPIDRAELDHYPGLEREEDHPTRWEMPSLLDRSQPWVASLAELYDDAIAFPASLSPQAGLLLHSLVLNHQPRRVVEVGTFCSVSTHWIASALPETTELHCFDDFGPVKAGPWRDKEMPDGRLAFVKDALARAGLVDRCSFYPGNSPDRLAEHAPNLKAQGGIDLAFIDGDHSKPGATADFLAIEPALNTGALVVLHDTFPERCGGWEGPRLVMNQVRYLMGDVKRRAGVKFSTRYVAEHANAIGSGIYERADLYLAPLNYGLAVLRRVG